MLRGSVNDQARLAVGVGAVCYRLLSGRAKTKSVAALCGSRPLVSGQYVETCPSAIEPSPEPMATNCRPLTEKATRRRGDPAAGVKGAKLSPGPGVECERVAVHVAAEDQVPGRDEQRRLVHVLRREPPRSLPVNGSNALMCGGTSGFSPPALRSGCAYQKANLPADQLISPVVRTPCTPSIRYASWQMLMSSRTSS